MVGLREQELVVGQVWLVLVGSTSGLDWIRDVRAARSNISYLCIPTFCVYSRATSSNVFCDRKRVCNGDNVLHVQIGLSVISVGGRLRQIRRTIFRVDEDD